MEEWKTGSMFPAVTRAALGTTTIDRAMYVSYMIATTPVTLDTDRGSLVITPGIRHDFGVRIGIRTMTTGAAGSLYIFLRED